MDVNKSTFTLKETMSVHVKILILEDEESDVDFLQRELKKSDLNYTTEVVHTKEAYESMLEYFRPDIILSDYSLPSFRRDSVGYPI